MTLLVQSCDPENAVCTWVRGQTGNDWLAGLAGGIVAPLTKAAIILLVTAVVAFVVRRFVRRLGRRMATSGGPGGMVERAAQRTTGAGPTLADPRRERRVESLSQVVVSITTVLVWTIGIMIALGAFDINLGPLIASAGVVGIAVGFGAQSLVEDFLSGLFMLAEDQFGIGDVIDVGDASGVVESVSLRTTSMRAVDGTLWHVTNGEIRRVGNMSQDWARAVLDIGVAYGASIDDARAVITGVAEDMAVDPDYDQVVLEPPDIQGVQDLSADAVVIRVAVKTLPGEQWGVARELRRRIKHALDDADIAIPFPQRQLWIRSDGEVLGDRGGSTEAGVGPIQDQSDAGSPPEATSDATSATDER